MDTRNSVGLGLCGSISDFARRDLNDLIWLFCLHVVSASCLLFVDSIFFLLSSNGYWRHFITIKISPRRSRRARVRARGQLPLPLLWRRPCRRQSPLQSLLRTQIMKFRGASWFLPCETHGKVGVIEFGLVAWRQGTGCSATAVCFDVCLMMVQYTSSPLTVTINVSARYSNASSTPQCCRMLTPRIFVKDCLSSSYALLYDFYRLIESSRML